METIKIGRRKFAVIDGEIKLVSTSITVQASVGENEQAFMERLTKMCSDTQGTIEIIFKEGRPDYAIVTFTRKGKE